MAENTGISWCDHTLNFWIGCTKVSPACDHCYAEAWAKRWPQYADAWNGKRYRTSESNWLQALRWNRSARDAGVRRRVFSNSLSDFFDKDVPPEWRADAWKLIRECDWLDFMLLTKRGPNIWKMLPAEVWPLPNVWLGITAEDQPRYNANIHHLCNVAAVRRFVSHEPALGPIDYGSMWLPHLDLVIFGGESGPAARPSHPDWARHDRDQCAEYGIAFHLKQWGEWATVVDTDGSVRSEGAGSLGGIYDRGDWYWINRGEGHADVWRLGKKAAGRLLDGREHSEMPS